MASSEHTSKKFDAELEAVRARVLQMGGLVEEQIRLATAQWMCVIDAIQSSLRDESFLRHPHPWVETHGYRQVSLRDGRHIDLEL